MIIQNKFGISEKNLQLIISVLQLFPEIKSAYMFGSRAMGNYKRGSDIDIALKGDINFDLLAKIKGQLDDEIATPYLYDIVVYKDIGNKELVKHIDQYGIRFYNS